MGIDILDVRHADDVVAGAAEHRHAAVPGFLEQRDERRKAVLQIEHHHVAARHADVAGLALAEVQHVLEHGALDGGQVVTPGNIVIMLVDCLLQAFAQARLVIMAGDEEAQRAPQSRGEIVATVRVGHGL